MIAPEYCPQTPMNTHGNFSKLDHILEKHLHKFRNTEITSDILSNHNPTKLHIEDKQNSSKYTNSWRYNSHY